MPPSEGHVKDATDPKYDFLRPVALMCSSLPNSQSLVHWFRLWFYITARCNLSSCETAKEKINFSLNQGLPLQQGFYIEDSTQTIVADRKCKYAGIHYVFRTAA